MVRDRVPLLFSLGAAKQLMVVVSCCTTCIKKEEARGTEDEVHRDQTLSPTFPH
jgi:hypothetical protein